MYYKLYQWARHYHKVSITPCVHLICLYKCIFSIKEGKLVFHKACNKPAVAHYKNKRGGRTKIIKLKCLYKSSP